LVRVAPVAARGEAVPLGAVTVVAVMVMAVTVTAVMVTVEVAAAAKTGLRLRHGAATTAVGTGAATVGVAAVTMVGNFWDQSWLP
jgi:hypothetical protein